MGNNVVEWQSGGDARTRDLVVDAVNRLLPHAQDWSMTIEQPSTTRGFKMEPGPLRIYTVRFMVDVATATEAADPDAELAKLRERVKALEEVLRPLSDELVDDDDACAYCGNWRTSDRIGWLKEHSPNCPTLKARALLTPPASASSSPSVDGT